MSLGRLVLVSIALIGILVVIGYAVLNENGRNASRGNASTALDDAANRLKKSREEAKSDEEIYAEASSLGSGFDRKISLEKISLLDKKVELCHKLIDSNSVFVEEAKDRLIQIYGFKMTIENEQGTDSSKSGKKLEQLRSQAVQEENKERIDLADFIIAYGRMKTLRTKNTREDFRLAAEAIKQIDGTSLRSPKQANQLQLAAIGLFDSLASKEDATLLLGFMGAKFSQSPDAKILEIGLDIKDYLIFGAYFAKIKASAFVSRDKRLELFGELFTQIEKTPPEGPRTFQETMIFLDQLLNVNDSQYMGLLLDKLSKAAASTNPSLKIRIGRSISKAKQRAASIGKVADLSGSQADGSALALPNGKKTVLVFWRSNDANSLELLKSLTTSNGFDNWTTNIVFASDSNHSYRTKQLIANKMSEFIVLDIQTSKAMMERLGIDLVPCVVSIAESGTVLKMANDVN